jgi:hypothetical protein
MLASQAFYSLSHASSPFWHWLFWVGSRFLPRQAYTTIHQVISISATSRMTGGPHLTQIFSKMGSCKHFCLGWPEMVILPILASHVVWDDRHTNYLPGLA